MHKYIEILNENEQVTNIKELSTIKSDFNLYSFDFSCNKGIIPLLILFNNLGIPSILSTKEIPGVPHIGAPYLNVVRYLCLFDSKNIVFNGMEPKNKIDFIIKKLNKLFTMSNVRIKQEYKKEYLYYWNLYSENKNVYNLYLNKNSKVLDVNIFYVEDRKYYEIKDPSIKFNYKWNSLKKEKLTTPCINLNLKFDRLPLPPYNESWNIDFFTYVISNNISSEDQSLLNNLEIPTNEIYILFSISYPTILPLNLLMKVEFNSFTKKKFKFKKKSIKKISHISSFDCSMEHSFKRIGTVFKPKNILIIGCGSLGSYIIEELPSLGVNNITLYDYDSLENGNIFRHKLKSESLFDKNKNKAILMSKELMNKHPQINVLAYDQEFNPKYFSDTYDLIIINTGDVDLQIKYNKIFKELNIKSPVLFNWIEYNGIGIHSLFINYSKKGCFKCLYENSSRNKMHFYNGEINLLSTGCGGTFNPYGNQILLKGTSMIIDIITTFFECGFTENLLFSTKLKNKFFNEINLTERFKKPIEELEAGTTDYYDSKCEECSI